MCRISKIITFLESLRQAGWFDLFESDIQALLIFDPLITLWGNFDAPYLKLLNDASVASACFYVRTCRRVRNSKNIATIRDFHLPGSFLCLSTRLPPLSGNIIFSFSITLDISCVPNKCGFRASKFTIVGQLRPFFWVNCAHFVKSWRLSTVILIYMSYNFLICHILWHFQDGRHWPWKFHMGQKLKHALISLKIVPNCLSCHKDSKNCIV